MAFSVSLLLLLIGFASQRGRATVTYQPTPLDGQGCPSDENKAQVIENIHSLIENQVETLTDISADIVLQVINKTGLTRALPAASCRQIFENRPDLPSGYYWIRSSNGTAVQLYCDMARQCCNETTGGWTRIAYLNFTDPNQQCPPAWNLITSPRRTCGRTTAIGCDSAIFPTNGITYRQVCGRVRAYQFATPDAFYPFNNGFTSIESSYVEGVSITHGSPRQHVWTFAGAFHEQYTDSDEFICACINTDNPFAANFLVPPFVGNDYFCDTGADDVTMSFITDDPLWDGAGCGPTNTCCEFNNPPWFCKTLPQPTTDDIEVRICTGNASVNNIEDTPVEQIEIYVS